MMNITMILVFLKKELTILILKYQLLQYNQKSVKLKMNLNLSLEFRFHQNILSFILEEKK